MGHHFKIEKISFIDLQWLDSLKELIAINIQETGDTWITVESVYSEIESKLNQGVWFLFDDKRVVGFMVASIATDLNGKRFGFGDYWFVLPEARGSGKAREMANMVINWCKENGVSQILFLTRRNEKAMTRYIGGDWKRFSSVVSLCV